MYRHAHFWKSLTIRLRKHKTNALPASSAPHAPLETVTAASAAAGMNIMYSLLTYPTLHDNLHGLRQCGACSQIQFTQ